MILDSLRSYILDISDYHGEMILCVGYLLFQLLMTSCAVFFYKGMFIMSAIVGLIILSIITLFHLI